ncbi:toll/interleukin-1 receptor domain-containing protein [Mesorhizobium sp. AaZ16]|uniref:toll/interleukin-1 receptor domain-containing protein n=1 Tax=Mesorhizobium sp. AaZ16 TaxID=3402289 RepID=UPI00374F3C60
MKAFISHSSNDKAFANQVFEELGELRCEYDEYTFEFTLNTIAIRNALRRCKLFVLLLSENSVRSTFVDEEIRSALEARSAGRIRNVVIFSIDGASYRSLPEWMREINVAQHLRSPKQIARRIDAYLMELSLKEGILADLYFGRENEEQEFSVRSKKS